MRQWLVLGGLLAGCVPSTHVVSPADAPVKTIANAPAFVIEEEPPSIPADGFAEDAVRPCSNDDDMNAARQAFYAVDTHAFSVDETSSAAQLKPMVDELTALLATPCFELARADLPDLLEFDSGLAFKTWWSDGQARTAIWEYLDGVSFLSVTVPSTPRPTFVQPGHERHPLAPLLCDSKDAKCGHETIGWLRRAESSFTKSARPSADVDECEKKLTGVEANQAWSTFYSCVVDASIVRTALPIGRFKAMTDGFFVVANEIGNCPSMSVYDLATGTAVRTNMCRSTTPRVTIGRVPLASIREAAWMAAMSELAYDTYRAPNSATIPKGVIPGRPRESGVGERIRLGGIYSTSTHRPWIWLRQKNAKLVGQVTGELWRVPSLDGARYAAELLEIAEDGFVAGCAPSFSSLGAVDWSASTPFPVEHEGQTPFDFDQPDFHPLHAALAKAKAPPKCTAPM